MTIVILSSTAATGSVILSSTALARQHEESWRRIWGGADARNGKPREETTWDA